MRLLLQQSKISRARSIQTSEIFHFDWWWIQFKRSRSGLFPLQTFYQHVWKAIHIWTYWASCRRKNKKTCCTTKECFSIKWFSCTGNYECKSTIHRWNTICRMIANFILLLRRHHCTDTVVLVVPLDFQLKLLTLWEQNHLSRDIVSYLIPETIVHLPLLLNLLPFSHLILSSPMQDLVLRCHYLTPVLWEVLN